MLFFKYVFLCNDSNIFINIILNFINNIELCITIKKLISIKATGQSSFVSDLKKIKIKKTTKKKFIYIIFQFFFFIIKI